MPRDLVALFEKGAMSLPPNSTQPWNNYDHARPHWLVLRVAGGDVRVHGRVRGSGGDADKSTEANEANEACSRCRFFVLFVAFCSILRRAIHASLHRAVSATVRNESGSAVHRRSTASIPRESTVANENLGEPREPSVALRAE